MDIRNRRALRQSASQALSSNSGAPQTVVLIYGGVSCLMALVSVILSTFLSNEIAGTGGLSNLGLRSILSTIQTVLPLVQGLVMMCLGLGYQSAMLHAARSRRAIPQDLTEGFRRFWPLFRTSLLEGCIYLAITMASLYLSVWIFMFLPVSQSFYALMEPVITSMSSLDASIAIDEATLMAAASAMAPLYFIFGAVFLLLFLPIFYQYRMSPYCLLDSGRPGAFAALRESRTMMKGNRIALFRLDLDFWWFYLLQVVISVVCYGDMLLPLLGVTFPWSDTISYFLFYILSLILQMVVYWFFTNRVEVTYATAYEALRPKPESSSGGVTLGNIFDLARDYKE